jgi:hypothetical protein
MGFNQRQARLGLRASAGNIDQAVQHIMQRKEGRGVGSFFFFLLSLSLIFLFSPTEKIQIFFKLKTNKYINSWLFLSYSISDTHYVIHVFVFFLVVMTMGFNQRQARLGLRASAGNIDQAVQHIMQRKEVRGSNFMV